MDTDVGLNSIVESVVRDGTIAGHGINGWNRILVEGVAEPHSYMTASELVNEAWGRETGAAVYDATVGKAYDATVGKAVAPLELTIKKATQSLSSILNLCVKKMMERIRREESILGAIEDVRYKAKEAIWIQRINNHEDVDDAEVAEAKRAMINAIMKRTRHLRVGANFWVQVVDKVANAIGSRYGTAAFAIAGMIVSKYFFI